MPKVSVIIPVYNTENYLRRCLDSVCSQTLSDIEIICINDCSTDNSFEILKEYSSKDRRIKLIDFKENKGAAVARNTGIDEAQGEYIGFVDSDDFIDLDFYEKLYKKAAEANADIAKGNYAVNGIIVDSHINSIIEKVKENNKLFAFEFCSAIFSRQIVVSNNIKFPILCDMEDPVFTFQFALCANKIEICETYIYINERIDSQTAGVPSDDRLLAKLEGLSSIISLANTYAKEFGGTIFYVAALWFTIVATNISTINLKSKLTLIEALFNIYNNVLYKEPFLYYIKELSPDLYGPITKQSIEEFLFLEKNKKIKELSAEIKEKDFALKNTETYSKYIFSHYAIENLQKSSGEKTYFISVVNNYSLYKKLILENKFISLPQNISCIDYDNTTENISIPIRYNSFLDSFDYNKDAWFIFCHCDWELLEDINPILSKLDKNYIYGPIGSKIDFYENKGIRVLSGFCYEKRRDGSGFRALGKLKEALELSDTFDCQAIIVHSSLIKKHNLRFDENLHWDLYVEDFSINAKLKFNIDSFALHFRSCHWSGYHKTPQSYYESLKYINKKYPNNIFSGTVSIIGGKDFQPANQKDIILYNLRKYKKTMDKTTIKVTK